MGKLQMQINIKTTTRTQLLDITKEVRDAVKKIGIKTGIKTGIKNGLVHVFSMHTTGAITINEGADPAVETDILNFINELVPFNNAYKHMEGNSDAHIKVSLIGPSEIIPLENGELVLGTWQAIYFCEFDGPRNRQVNVHISSE
jgi:secondary thiamine-phosphate synthase enzyme